MDINLLRNLITVASVVFFAGIVWWAYAPSRKHLFEKNGRIVLEADEAEGSQ